MSCAASCGFFGNPATFNLCSSCLKLYPDGKVPQSAIDNNIANAAAVAAAKANSVMAAFANPRRPGLVAPPPKLEPIGGIAPHMVPDISTGIKIDTPYSIWDEGDYGAGAPPRTLLELDMMRLSATIREKERWWDKYTNPEIVAKWREEVKGEFTEAQFNFVLAGLAYYDSLRDGKIQVSGTDGVWQADDLIPSELQQQLLDGVAPMENVPDHEKDWHPGSNKQVLDLVHPSLFPLIYGVSHTVPADQAKPSLRMMNGGETAGFVPKDVFSRHDPSVSKKFAWLPSEFQVHDDGSVTIESYINNLHPIKFAHMYGTIARIFERFVPLFNKVLTDFGSDRTPRLQVDAYDWYDKTGEPDAEDYEAWDEWNDNRPFKEIEIPEEFAIPNPPEKVIDLNGKRLQVIVKLANIILTPENPRYPGGSWHIEGMKNENIAASGIYYYKSENISESRLKFRQAVCEPDYEQNDNRGVEHFFGLSNEEALNQELASVETKEGRCLCFPNYYQHCVQPFELVDKTKPGVRKILVFFLVDPSERVVSTATIPPQQQEWYFEAVKNKFPFTMLPKEIVQNIVRSMDFPLSLEKAKEYREQLMAERKAFVEENSQTVFSREFSLCEH